MDRYLYTVALVMRNNQSEPQYIYAHTSFGIDLAYSKSGKILKYTHVWANEPSVAIKLAETLFRDSNSGKWVDPGHWRSKDDIFTFVRTLAESRYSVVKTAKILGINRKTVYRWAKKYNVKIERKINERKSRMVGYRESLDSGSVCHDRSCA